MFHAPLPDRHGDGRHDEGAEHGEFAEEEDDAADDAPDEGEGETHQRVERRRGERVENLLQAETALGIERDETTNRAHRA